MTSRGPDIVLVGYRGAGKSAVGRALADQLGWPLVETDQLVRDKAGLSIAEIFTRYGEERFRQLEAAVIGDLEASAPAVVSAGGGAVLRPENVARLRSIGTVVWLTASPEELWRRISNDPASRVSRPDLTAAGGLEEVRRVLEARTPLYRAASDLQIDTAGRTSSQVAELILSLIRGGPPGQR